ncbi:MAG TPA: cobalamin-binding protein [Gammaproteobacteria bacterium]|nr:cobalamin-binding protein [Gammaproteobacteria bacterium]
MKRILLATIALSTLLPLAASAAKLHLKGADGVELTLARPAQRVVSLAPDLAELLYDIGAGDSLQGAVEYTDYPATAKTLPRVGDAFHVDVEKLVALKPDLVLAWEGGTPEPLIVKLRALKVPVLALGTHELLDIASNMEMLGLATGHADAAQLAADDFRTFLGALRERYANQPPLTAFYEISPQPLFTVGGQQSISKLMEVCGAHNVFADLTDLAPAVTLESVLARNPQVIITGDGEGDAAERFKDWQRWPGLAATQQGNFVILNDDWVSRATPRLLNAGKQLCEALQRIRDKTAAH